MDEKEQYYRSKDELLRKFVTAEFDFNKVLEFYRYDAMFHAIIEMMLRGGLDPYAAISTLVDANIRTSAAFREYVEHSPYTRSEI